jgi:F-type H+-transporting ATPase subunit epsilon
MSKDEPQKYLSVDLVTPVKIVYTDHRVNLCQAPGALGELGILPGHMPLVSLLEKGWVKIREREGNELWFEIDGGFLQVLDDQVLILAERVIPRE